MACPKDQFYAAMKECFQQMDKNGDGKISKNEIQSLMTEMYGHPVKQEIVDWIMETADKDKSGQIDSIDELIAGLQEIEIIEISSQLSSYFKKLDKDGNGMLTKDEIKEGWKKNNCGSEEELDGLLAAADTVGNKDGLYNCDEFVEFIICQMMNK